MRGSHGDGVERRMVVAFSRGERAGDGTDGGWRMEGGLFGGGWRLACHY